MDIAFVGCGYVADFYARTLVNHPDLRLRGVYDTDPERLRRYADYWSVPPYAALEDLLDDERIGIVVNLTNPRSHYAVSKAALAAGKHVYSEKPLGMNYAEAAELVALAESRGCRLAGAPCSVLGECAQTLWKALREGRVGTVRLVYANLDDGMVHTQRPGTRWQNESGASWPAQDEFEVGCTFEHAGYYLSWLAAFFGQARRVTAFASVRLPDKGVSLAVDAPDFSVGCIEYESGPVARITCSIVAPLDRSLTVVGDRGVLRVTEAWNYGAPVHFRPLISPRWKRGLRRFAGLDLESERLRLVRPARFVPPRVGHPMDFCRGIAELAEAIESDRPCRLSAGMALQVTELTAALQHPAPDNAVHVVQSRLTAPEPMAWAV